MKDLDQKWRSWKYDLRTKFFTPYQKAQQHFACSDTRVKCSETNKQNKSKETFFHCASSKSFADIYHEEFLKPGATLDRGDFRMKKARGPVNDESAAMISSASVCHPQKKKDSLEGRRVRILNFSGEVDASGILMSDDNDNVVMGKKLGGEYYEVSILIAHDPTASLFIKDADGKNMNDVVGSHIIWFREYVFEDITSTRLLPLGQLRSRKRETRGLHPLKKKVTILLSRSRRRQEDSRIPFIRKRPQPCRIHRDQVQKATLKVFPSWCTHFPKKIESYLNPVYDENQDAAFYTSQDYEESLPHDLFGESTRPWVATVHASESHHHDDGGPALNAHLSQADDQAPQLLHLIPQLDHSQSQNLMTALKGKTVSSHSPRAGASHPMAPTSSPRIIPGQADNTPIRPRTI
ncbi:hypothetical protein Taro_033603 [Colocasia esculenta]|uniref:Uncharacterized protein n=1 Tax=Colocasia esculenta TaxID=4460 RepID=A0A843W7F8_COLES|nr:hypothetical protein [Colocasia esculenta]